MKRSTFVRVANQLESGMKQTLSTFLNGTANRSGSKFQIVGSGTTYHSWRNFGGSALKQPATALQPHSTNLNQNAVSMVSLQRFAWFRAAGLAPQVVGRVAAGHQQTRGFSRFMSFPNPGSSGRGWNSWQDWDPSRVLWGIIAANGAVFILWGSNPRLCIDHFTVSMDSLREGRLHTLVTAAFSQKDFMHFAANMIGLYFFGRDIGRLFGGKKLLALYLAGGAAGSLAHCGWYYYKASQRSPRGFGRPHFLPYSPPALGASAAVNAVMVLDILLFPTRTILLYGIIPMPAALLGALWLLRDISGTMEGGGHIAHVGHLGGASMGLAFWVMFRRGRIRPRGWW